MATKRAAKKAAAAAPPPPHPPPAESSDETRSGSRSRSDDSDDEEVLADSPVPAPTPTLKNAPAPSQKGGESESSEEEEEENDEEEEEPVRAAPKNQHPPPPPQKKEDSETSGDEEEDDDEEEEAQQKEPTRAAPPSALKKQPPTPQKKEDSDTSGDEGESDEEVPPPPPTKPAPKKDAEALKPRAAAPAAAETKKPGAAQRIWSTDDEVRILEALAAHQKQHGTFMQTDALVDVLAGKLDNPAYGSKELHSKVGSLRHRYKTLSMRGELPSKEHDRRLLQLGKLVWTGDKITSPSTATAVVKAANNGQERKGFEEMCELYPYLAEEMKGLEAAHPGLCKREFGKMDDDKARAIDQKIKRQRVAQIRLEMRRSDLAKEVAKALVDLVDG